jgi:ribosomal protein S18 acetylase RimI-like enzyme
MSGGRKVMPVAVENRRVGQADAALFDQVAPGVFDAPIDPERLSAYLAAPGHLMIVARQEGVVVGQVAALLHRHPDKPTQLYIDEVAVTPAMRRRGIARRMLTDMLVWGREQGCAEVWVGTECDNVAARGLYESLDAAPVPFMLYLSAL